MANDPRANTQLFKPCPPSYLGKAGAIIADSQSQRQKAFNALGKVGDLEILNNKTLFGSTGSRVGQGLRTLASISNSVRTGCGALPTVIGGAVGTALDTGANWVLENVGFSKTAVDQARYFNPGIANQAYGQAQQIYQRVKQGNFNFNSIPSVLQDFQNLERLVRNIYTPPKSVQSKFKDICEASPYAVDFVFRAPKYKFLFLVQFIYSSGYSGLDGLDFTFMVKKSSRPHVNVEMEDVNYYNFRSKVITKTRFDDMTMSFHDDGLNFATRFYAAYLKATAPIANLRDSAMFSDAENDGMNFGTESTNTILNPELAQIDPIGIPGNFYTGTRGPLVDDNKQVIREIRLFHFFDWGQKMNVFKFFNPRITQLNLDDVDMAAGNEVNDLQITFNYDSVYVDTDIPIDNKEYSIESQQRAAFYVLKNVKDGASSGPQNIGITKEQAPRAPGACNAPGVQNTSIPPTGPVGAGGAVTNSTVPSPLGAVV